MATSTSTTKKTVGRSKVAEAKVADPAKNPDELDFMSDNFGDFSDDEVRLAILKIEHEIERNEAYPTLDHPDAEPEPMQYDTKALKMQKGRLERERDRRVTGGR